MIRNSLFLFILLFFPTILLAALTPNNVAKVQTGGTTPRLTNSNISDNSGSIGIGTTVPTSDLHILNNSGVTLSMQTNSTDGHLRIQVDNNADETNETAKLEFRRDNSTSDNWVMGLNGANGGNFNISNAGGDFGGTEYFIITTGTGNIGIGENNSNPSATLDISTTDSQNIVLVEDNGDADPTPFIIDSVGNVGIGTVTASHALRVTGTVFATTSFQAGGSGAEITTSTLTIPTVRGGTSTNSQLTLRTTGTASPATTSAMLFQTNSSGLTAMTIDNLGNIGVGTSVPKSQLSINGSVGIGTANSVYIQTTPPLGGALVEGNIGIGTNIPNANLHVNSSFRMTPTDTPPTCNAAFEGGIYYDNSLNEMCDCDGTSWAQVDGGGAC